MILTFIALLPLLVFSIWAYVRTRPRAGAGQSRYLLLFDGMIIICAIAASALEIAYFKHALENTPDREWWPVLSAMAWLVTAPVLLLIGGLLRKILFR